MSGAACPACGVAVVPGYVRCPKCRKPLPQRTSVAVEGGTALESHSRFPALAALAAAVLVGGGIIAYFSLNKDDAPEQPAPATSQPQETGAVEPEVVDPSEAPSEPPTAVAGPDPQSIAADLERRLKRQRLWSTVTVTGGRVEVRSGSCGDPAMAPLLDSAAAPFKAAGLTKLRCVEQSGRVVVDRDL